jgi:hypothetical protein
MVVLEEMAGGKAIPAAKQAAEKCRLRFGKSPSMTREVLFLM